jgi:Holliday junction DNA helicase RuvA
MITRITGQLVRVLDEELRLLAGPFEYQILVPEFIRRQVQTKIGQELSFHTLHYFDGNPMQGHVVPRLVGFMSETELEFFELFCTVEKIGTKKALKALVRPVKEVADAIQRQDSKWLTTLPGIGGPTAEKIVTTLKRKVTKFALAPTRTKTTETGEVIVEPTPTSALEASVLDEAYQALIALGNNPIDARTQLDKVIASGKEYKNVEDVLRLVYNR